MLEIPGDHEVAFLPQGKDFQSDHHSFSISYTESENQVIYDQTVRVDKLYYEIGELDTWDQFVSAMENEYKETILIRSNQ